ncbi:conserved Plasmodium protein, unknown function [Plasmodium vivax]|uniref:(malaria parasite P. vivax) hypothetical protein n=2 Tax=Plasmodium vivax TaxID=5855 RepID=A0A1G4GV88_PLAVI|nr:unnamed protein product [Plasmodium vivax]SCO66494.1 conserved Plasmodium protein, unknown function [Plasmodium vivax]SCO71928.1 conserved Plasmodium protein, unknown function [Plasmodium vivax]
MLLLERMNTLIENKYAKSNWKRKKFVWRYSLFFTTFYICLSLGILYTLAVRLLISSETYSNHFCPSSTILSVKRLYMAILIFLILMGFLNFLFSRLTFIYSNFTNSEFFNSGFFYALLGFIIKYMSWLLSLVYISWICFLFVNMLIIIFWPHKWCTSKYNAYGMDALRNCLLVKNRATGCEIDKALLNLRTKDSCNDYDILKVHNFLFLARSAPNQACTLKDKKLCEFFVDFIKNKNTSWTTFPNCSGNTPDLKEEHFLEEPTTKSDIYLFSLSLIFFWFLTTVVLIALFVVVRVSTPIDSSFVVNEERFNFFFKFTRLMDVWR